MGGKNICCVESCASQIQGDLSFFRCPKERRRCQKWKNALGFTGSHKYSKLTPEQCHSCIRICSLHFDEASFSNSSRSRIHNDSVPSLMLTIDSAEKEHIPTITLTDDSDSNDSIKVEENVRTNEVVVQTNELDFANCNNGEDDVPTQRTTISNGISRRTKMETEVTLENVMHFFETCFSEESCTSLKNQMISLLNSARRMPSLNRMHIMENNRQTTEVVKETQPSSPDHDDQPDENSNSSQQNGDPLSNGIDDDPKLDVEIKEIKVEEDCCNNSNHSGEKRKLDGDSSEDSTIKKRRLRTDLEQNYVIRDKILNEYIDNAACSSVQQVEYHMDQVLTEIKMLNELAREKEKEWNNIIHLKKVKEELLLRIQRQKQIMLLNNDHETSMIEPQPDILKNIRTSKGLMVFSTSQGKKIQNNKAAHLNTYMELTNGFNNSKLNNNNNPPQRPVIDVQSIIADYRQRHPEAVPRRGRRIRSLLNSQGDNNAPNSFSSIACSTTDQGGVINLSSISLGSGAHVKHNMNSATIDSNGEMSVLLSGSDLEHQETLHVPGKPPPPYSEVTVHPVPLSTQSSTSSLLHGILTKTHSKAENTKSTYSPTLARLLTAPERSTDSPQASLSITDMLSNNKARNEITITPVGQFDLTVKEKGTMNDDEVEDTSDRLVIDETDVIDARNGLEELVDEVPQCQGCNQKAAQFVCAGCGNQWYCSRECQVIAWDEHSEVCSG